MFYSAVKLIGINMTTLKYPIQGQSFAETLTKGKQMQRSYFVSESWSQVAVISKDYKLGIMLNPTDANRKFDFMSFGSQFFIRKSDSLEINNQINDKKYITEIALLQSYYKDFQHKTLDIGKQEIINS